jgi:hypothetical protein
MLCLGSGRLRGLNGTPVWAVRLSCLLQTFPTLYVLFISHGRRQLIHFEATDHPNPLRASGRCCSMTSSASRQKTAPKAALNSESRRRSSARTRAPSGRSARGLLANLWRSATVISVRGAALGPAHRTTLRRSSTVTPLPGRQQRDGSSRCRAWRGNPWCRGLVVKLDDDPHRSPLAQVRVTGLEVDRVTRQVVYANPVGN